MASKRPASVEPFPGNSHGLARPLLASIGEKRNELKEIDRQCWRLWTINFTVTGALIVALLLIFYPALSWKLNRLEIRTTALPQLLSGLTVLVVLETFYLVNKQRELNELRIFIVSSQRDARLRTAQSPKDSLTGALDRRALPEVLEREIGWVERYEIPLCAVMLNIREFRKVNEREGHFAADMVLRQLAQTVQATLRQTDSILRYESDRFLCLLPRTDDKGGEAFARRVLNACQLVPRLRDLQIEFGFGVYKAGGTPDALLASAESSLVRTRNAD